MPEQSTDDPRESLGDAVETGEIEEEEEDLRPATPLDHPLFLPVILLGMTIWFGYDGFINQDPDMLEHLTFNRWGFGALALATVWFGRKGLAEMRARKQEASQDGSDPPSGLRPPPLH